MSFAQENGVLTRNEFETRTLTACYAYLLVKTDKKYFMGVDL